MHGTLVRVVYGQSQGQTHKQHLLSGRDKNGLRLNRFFVTGVPRRSHIIVGVAGDQHTRNSRHIDGEMAQHE